MEINNLFIQPKEEDYFTPSEPSPTPVSSSAIITQTFNSLVNCQSSADLCGVSSAPITKKVIQKTDQTKFNVNSESEFVYIEPEILFKGTMISKKEALNFALIKTDDKKKLVPVISAFRERNTGYRIYEGSALEALLKIAQEVPPGRQISRSPIKSVLDNPNNSIVKKEEFLKFILEEDEKGRPRICTLNSASTLDVLNIFKDENGILNLNKKTKEGDSLFTLWARKGDIKITKLMLELNPDVIDETEGLIESPFVESVLKRTEQQANLLMNAMKNRNLLLSKEEIWINNAFKNQLLFSEEEFKKLDEDLKIKTYFVANAFGNEEMVKKLKTLGMDTDPLFYPGPAILANNMDIVTTRAVIENFFKDLRREGLLFTEEEFNKLDKKNYISKSDQIGRILGKNFIEKLVKEHGLKYIKVPKKIVVVNKELDAISLRIECSLELIPKGNQLKIYAERIQPVDRKLSLEEAIEFMIILEKTGYQDFLGQNFFIAEDGIYFIDTEFNNFSPNEPLFNAIQMIKDLLNPNDVGAFLFEYEKRKKAYDNEKEMRDGQEKTYNEAFKNPYKNLIDCYRRREFTFLLSSLNY